MSQRIPQREVLREIDSTGPELRMCLREPCRGDGADIWSLVETCGELDLNSPYAYLLMCTDFCETGLVARRIEDESRSEGELIGFVLGYRPPQTPEAVFVWQVGVAPAYRGKGMGSRLLAALFDRCQSSSSVDHLEATVTPSNLASRTLFTRFARERSAPMQESVAFRSSDFPVSRVSGQTHEDEIRLRIGPVERTVA